jgi:DNA helicase IV
LKSTTVKTGPPADFYDNWQGERFIIFATDNDMLCGLEFFLFTITYDISYLVKNCFWRGAIMGFKLPNGADLSGEQLDIINLPTTKDWVIKGAPGTGKTVMAIYRAGQASKTSKGKPVLMLVYNRPLMSFISTAVKGTYYKNVYVLTYHQWLNDIYREYHLRSVPKVGKDFDWPKVDSDLAGIGKKYSHIIIDEAQDFSIELLKILKRISDHITCFIDPNQAVEKGKTGTAKAIKAICVESPFTLTKNFRNTKPIRDLTALYCKDGVPAPSNTSGKKPVITLCKPNDFVDLNKKMLAIIKQNKEKDIGIIVNNKSQNKTYESIKNANISKLIVQMHKADTKHKIDFDKRGVKIVSYGTMKGLEFDIVLLPLFDKIKMEDGGDVDTNRVYVALSRPVFELYLFYWSEETSPGWIDTMSTLTANRNMLVWK